MYEYSYFKAEGRSLVAIERVEEAKKERLALERLVCRRFNAESLSGEFEPNVNAFVIHSMAFEAERKMPQGWKALSEPSARGDVLAMPETALKDVFYLQHVCGLFLRAHQLMQLEAVLGCREMPDKFLPAGSYNCAFVRSHSLKDRPQAGDMDAGFVMDNTTKLFCSDVPVTLKDPVDYMNMSDGWYIRVPNNTRGEPLFAPPDALSASYEMMWQLDREEFGIRLSRLKGSSFPSMKKQKP